MKEKLIIGIDVSKNTLDAYAYQAKATSKLY